MQSTSFVDLEIRIMSKGLRGNTIFLFAWRGQSFQMCKCWRINHVFFFFFFTILCFLTLSVTCTTSCYPYLSLTCNFCYQYLILLLEPLSHKYISITCTFLLPVPFCYSHLSFTFIIYPSMLSVLIMLISKSVIQRVCYLCSLHVSSQHLPNPWLPGEPHPSALDPGHSSQHRLLHDTHVDTGNSGICFLYRTHTRYESINNLINKYFCCYFIIVACTH